MTAQPLITSRTPLLRRDFLRHFSSGFGHVALTTLLAADENRAQSATVSSNPLAGKAAHFAPRVKRVIFLFLHGGVSHIDTFDPKPTLAKLDGQPVPIEKPKFNFAPTGNLLASPWKFRKYGQSGIEVSDLFPQIGSCVDDICIIRSMQGNFVAHGSGCLQLHTGDGSFMRPSMGSWILYGLGSESDNLPGFITISPSSFHGGSQNYGSAFLPASYQATRIGDGATSFLKARMSNLAPAETSRHLQRRQLDLLRQQNRQHLDRTGHDARMEARIESYELAFRMQMAAPEVMDFADESQETLQLYGIDTEPTDEFGRQCLMARRFSENGVRFVQVSHSYPKNYWDSHSNLKKQHGGNAPKVDQPIAGLLRDLKRRGLWDDTLVVCGTEFGRTPAAQGKNGRDHHSHAFTMWLAGGGLKGGLVHGATDELGYYVTEDRVHIHDLHATILHLLGLDHERLTYRYSGRDFRLTDVYGRVVKEIFA
jgi:hypothetical protein